jgi:outer membrane autotransporter protein
MTPTPGLNLGVSVDHSHTRIDLPTVLQNARLDLTQIGGYISVERGPWTFSLAGTHGEGRIHSERDTGGGIATASYTGRIDGALAEVSYYHAMGQGRIVPKAAVEYTRSVTGALQEIGGVNPISAGAGVTERARLMIGAEVGRYFILNQHVLDISGYAKFIDNFHQRIGNVQVTPQFGLPVAVTGILESTTGADAGAAVSFNITNTTRVYAAYDGKFRTGFESHTGTLGIDVRW